MEQQVHEKTFVDGLRAATTTGFGYISIGLAFGVVSAASGLSAIDVALLSVLVYGGAAQFAIVAMLVAGQSLTAIVTTTFFINLRNLLLSLHAATFFPQANLFESILMGSLITDETYGVLLGEKNKQSVLSVSWMYGNNLVGYLAWVGSTIAGNLLGSFIPNPEQFGLDYALVAMFLGIFSGQLTAMMQAVPIKKIGLILVAVLLAYLTLSMFLLSSVAVLVATLIGCGVGVYLDER